MAYSNADLAAIPPHKRTWSSWNFATLWVAMSIQVPVYMLASSLISGGMNWWQATLTILVGNLLILIPMLLNGHVGVKYGIPFPVFARASFGVRGANVPATLRAVVACGWFGIQTWIGGSALYQLIQLWVPAFAHLPRIFPAWVGLDTGAGITFILFWLANMAVVYLGANSIRKLLVFKAILLPMVALGLLIWALTTAGDLGIILRAPSKFKNDEDFWAFFFPALTGIIGFWATLSLNIPDFTRYGRSQRDQIIGQSLGLPLTMTLFSLVGIIVTSTTTVIFGTLIWDPLVLASKLGSPFLVSVSLLTVAFATLATNIAANIVSPANDFSNLAPRKIDFRLGGYITGVAGIVIFPWKLIADPTGYIFKWLIAYSGLLGAIGGILIVDYYLIRQKSLDINSLYAKGGKYWYHKGFNLKALFAMFLGVSLNIPGFLAEIKIISASRLPGFITHLYHYAWFISFIVSAVVYYLLMPKTLRENRPHP